MEEAEKLSEFEDAPDKRKEAFKLFCRYDNKAMVARKLKVSAAIVYQWSRQDEWEVKREEIRNKLKIHFDFLRSAADNETVRLIVGDIAFLNHLQEIVSEKILTQAIEPKTWRDVIETQRFISEQKEKILGQIRKDTPPSTPKPPSSSIVGDANKFLRDAVNPESRPEGS